METDRNIPFARDEARLNCIRRISLVIITGNYTDNGLSLANEVIVTIEPEGHVRSALRDLLPFGIGGKCAELALFEKSQDGQDAFVLNRIGEFLTNHADETF